LKGSIVNFELFLHSSKNNKTKDKFRDRLLQPKFLF
jgi:hypothetical protein